MWMTVWTFLKKLYVKLPREPAIPLLDIYAKEFKAGSQKILAHHVHHSVIHYGQEAGKHPTVR